MFRYKRGIKLDYTRQGYIYFTSRMYDRLPADDRQKIDALCLKYGGEYYEALLEFVSTDATATALCMRHYISRATLYRAVRRYYENFPEKL